MTAQALFQIAFYFAILLALAQPLGSQLLRTYRGEPTWLLRLLTPAERWLCDRAGVPAGPGPLPAAVQMRWPQYVLALLACNGAAVVAAYVLQRLSIPIPAAAPALLRTAALLRGLVSVASGLAVLLGLLRGLSPPSRPTVGNFWVDLIRGSCYLLLPLSLVVALLLSLRGVLRPLAAVLARALGG